jgi:hypothetical protein
VDNGVVHAAGSSRGGFSLGWRSWANRPPRILAPVIRLRVHTGLGYRVYFTRSGSTIYLLLTGGDKSSQETDIRRAKRMAAELKEKK